MKKKRTDLKQNKRTRILPVLCLSLFLAACEAGGPGDAIPELETPKQSTIGIPKQTTAPVSTTASATEASAPIAPENDPTASAPDGSAADGTTAAVTTEAPTTEPPGPTIPVIDTDYEVNSKLTDDMYNAATNRLGSDNTFRMAGVIKKAQAGEPVTVVMLGAAALTGQGAVKPAKSTEELLHEYWKEMFPASELSIILDTQSANDPYFAIHRAARFVAVNPDLVMIDYSAVDDGSDETTLYLENLVRRYMTCDSQPAVMLLFSNQVQQDDKDSQRTIGVRYRLPMLSFGDAIAEGLEENVFSDRSQVITESNILTGVGHAVYAATLERYFNTIRAYIRSDKFNTSYVLPDSTPDASRYNGSHIADNETIRPSAKSGISKGSAVSQDYPNGWSSNSAGFEITFKITSRNLGILYRVVPDAAGAIVDVFVDGNYVKTISCGDTELTAPCDRSTELYNTGAKATHIVTMRQKSGTAGSFFALLALLVS